MVKVKRKLDQQKNLKQCIFVSGGNNNKITKIPFSQGHSIFSILAQLKHSPTGLPFFPFCINHQCVASLCYRVLSPSVFPPLPTHNRQRQPPRTSHRALLMPSDHPEPPSLAPFEVQADPAPPPAKGGGKMHRLLRSAFKRGDSASASSGTRRTS
jgi:hypothetical protein